MKKLLVFALAILVAGSLLAAGSQEDVIAASADSPITLKVGYEMAPDEPVSRAMKLWAEIIEERSDGKIKFDLFPSSQLGSKKDLVEQMLNGANVMTITDPSFLAEYNADFGILTAPYLTTNWDQIFKITDSDWFASLAKGLEKKGLKIITTEWAFGIRHILTKTPVKTPEDLKGMKIRTPNNKMYIETFNMLGAAATPMPFGEAYTALTQGVIDGLENILSAFYGAKQYEVAKYISLTRHQYLISEWVVSMDFWNSLSPEFQEIFINTAHEAGVIQNDIAREEDESIINKLRSEGVTFIDPDIAAFKEKTLEVYSRFPEWSPGLYEKIQGILLE